MRFPQFHLHKRHTSQDVPTSTCFKRWFFMRWSQPQQTSRGPKKIFLGPGCLLVYTVIYPKKTWPHSHLFFWWFPEKKTEKKKTGKTVMYHCDLALVESNKITWPNISLCGSTVSSFEWSQPLEKPHWRWKNRELLRFSWSHVKNPYGWLVSGVIHWFLFTKSIESWWVHRYT